MPTPKLDKPVPTNRATAALRPPEVAMLPKPLLRPRRLTVHAGNR